MQDLSEKIAGPSMRSGDTGWRWNRSRDVDDFLDQFERALPGTASGAGHRHLDPVSLPDGTTVWATSFPPPGYDREQPPDFGLYLDARWQPPWPHSYVDWADFGLPADHEAMIGDLDDLLSRARRGETVEVGCLGGHGRTGTALACLAVLAGISQDPVDWVRSVYCEHAIETKEQVELVRQLYDQPTSR